MINDIGILADLENAKNAATAAERAAVVAWLRQASERMNNATLAHAADCVEDGEHRRMA